jgi:hypothetical protein
MSRLQHETCGAIGLTHLTTVMCCVARAWKLLQSTLWSTQAFQCWQQRLAVLPCSIATACSSAQQAH